MSTQDVPVSVLVVENAKVHLDELQLPSPREGFSFKWHPASKTSIDGPYDGDRLKVYEEFETLLAGEPVTARPDWQPISGYCIIFFDLGLELQEFPAEKASRVDEWLGGAAEYAFLYKQEQGLYLAGVALRNHRWDGAVIIASQQTADNDVQRSIAALASGTSTGADGSAPCDSDINRRIAVRSGGGALSGRALLAARQAVLDTGIDTFLEQCGSLERRLWPSYTDDWYPDALDVTSAVPHDLPTDTTACERLIRQYLALLFRREPPDAWFSARQFPVLFEELKHLVGACCVCGSGNGHRLTLGNLVILLAANTASPERWWGTIDWSAATAVKPKSLSNTLEILPVQTKEQARYVVRCLSGLFPALTATKSSGKADSGVESVTLTPYELQIRFNCDHGDPSDTSSLLYKVTHVPVLSTDEVGGVYALFRDFLLYSSISKEEAREAFCVLNVLRDPDGTVFEFVPAFRRGVAAGGR